MSTADGVRGCVLEKLRFLKIDVFYRAVLSLKYYTESALGGAEENWWGSAASFFYWFPKKSILMLEASVA